MNRIFNEIEAGCQPARAMDASAVERNFRLTGNALALRVVPSLDAVVVTKSCAGFDEATVADLSRLLAIVGQRGLARVRYLVYDFAHGATAAMSAPAEGFEEAMSLSSRLIRDVPVITVAWARSHMAGADLDWALYCSMLVAEQGARFSFDGDPSALFALYAALARRIGLVRTERLIENGDVLDAAAMRDLRLVKDVVEPDGEGDGVEAYLAQQDRRYNAAWAIYRAQSIAMAPSAQKPENMVFAHLM